MNSVADVIASRGERLELLVDKTEDLSNNVRVCCVVLYSPHTTATSSSVIVTFRSLTTSIESVHLAIISTDC